MYTYSSLQLNLWRLNANPAAYFQPSCQISLPSTQVLNFSIFAFHQHDDITSIFPSPVRVLHMLPSNASWTSSLKSANYHHLHVHNCYHSVLPRGFFCRVRRPAPFSWCPALLKKTKWRPALFFKNISHTWLLALFCPFCCPHTAWIVTCIFYWAIQGHF